MGFEPTITASERSKTVHALDRTATVIGKGFVIIKLHKTKNNTNIKTLCNLIVFFCLLRVLFA
jgi:FAD synthase